jgi:hypothetical protein
MLAMTNAGGEMPNEKSEIYKTKKDAPTSKTR